MRKRDSRATSDGGKPELAINGAGGDGGGAPNENNGSGPATVDLGSIAGSVAPVDGAGTGTGANSGDGGIEQPKRGRGRPRGSGNAGQKAKPVPSDVNGIERILIGIHTAVATLSGVHEWSLDTESKDYDGKSESAYLAASGKAVADHYEMKYFDQKTVDWFNLLQAFAIVYGTRLYAIRSRRASERAERAANRMPPVQGAAPVNTPQRQTTEAKPNGAAPVETRLGIIPGMPGGVEFPADHPLAPKMQQ